MLYKIAVIIFAIWISVYEISYAAHEYRQGGKAAATGTALLVFVVLILTFAVVMA